MFELTRTGSCTYKLVGVVNLASVMTIRRKLDVVIAWQDRTELDLSQLDIEGSAILTLLLYSKRQAIRSGGTLRVVNSPDRLKKIAALANVEQILDI